MKTRDQYKKLINFGARVILIALQLITFAYIWYTYYSEMASGVQLYYRRGNWAVIGIYILILFFFTRAFGG